MIRPVSASAGDRANAAASHGRRGSTPASSQAASRASTAKPTALTTTKARVSARTFGIDHSRSTGVAARGPTSGDPLTQWVTQAAPQAQYAMPTGYSMTSYRARVPGSSEYGQASSANPRPV